MNIKKSFVFFLSIVAFYMSSYHTCAQPQNNLPPESEQAELAYERTVEMVKLENATPRQMEQSLATLTKNWNLFPSIQFLIFQVPGIEKEVLFLRGYTHEVKRAGRLAELLDGLYPDLPDQADLFRIPLNYVSAPAMREKLLALSRSAGPGWTPDQFLIFPPGRRGSLFFRGTGPEAKRVRELKEELDQPRYESFFDMLTGFWRIFREDISSHFLVVTTYVVSALLLLLLHFLLVNVPWLGKRYERCFTLIWTKILDNVKGRDFAFEVIKSIAETAVESAEQYSLTEVKQGLRSAAEVKPEEKKARAIDIARELLIYRGFKPDDPQVRRMVDDVIEAKVYKLKSQKGD